MASALCVDREQSEFQVREAQQYAEATEPAASGAGALVLL